MKRFATLVLGAAAIQLVWIQSALGCPVCFAGSNDENTAAFASMTGFMTILPLTLIGSAVWWYVRRIRELEKSESRAKPNRAPRRITRRRPSQARGGELLTAPEGYFERGYASTAKGR